MHPDSPEVREKVIQQAKSWLGTPFCHQALVKGVGVGCGTFLIDVYGATGVPVPSLDSLGYFPKDWHEHCAEERYLNILRGFSKEVETPQPGDIALFKIGKVHGHSAVVVAWPRVIHVMWGSKVEYADVSKSPLQRRHCIFLSPFE